MFATLLPKADEPPTPKTADPVPDEAFGDDYEWTSAYSLIPQIVGSPSDPAPLVTPIGQAECDTCPYEAPCAAAMGDDPSAAIYGGQAGHPRVAHAAVDGRQHDPRARRA